MNSNESIVISSNCGASPTNLSISFFTAINNSLGFKEELLFNKITASQLLVEDGELNQHP